MRRVALLALGLLALAVAPADAQEQTPDVPPGDAEIRGRLVPAGGESVADAPVILYSLSPSGDPGLRTTRSDASGAFAFPGISGDPAVVYLVGARVGGVPFGTRTRFAANERLLRVEVPISAPTQSLEGRVHGDVRLRLERGCTHLRVQQSQTLRNDSKQVIHVPPELRASATPLFQATLPAGAEGFEPMLSAGIDGFERSGDALRYWGPLHPGEHEIEWGYGLPLEDSIALRIPLPDGAPRVDVLTPAGALRVESAQLESRGEQRLPSGAHALATAGPVAPGGALDLRVERVDSPDATPPRLEEVRLWLELDDAALDVSEQHLLRVEGQEPLESAGAPLLCVPLPAEAQDLRFATGTLGMGLTRDPSGALALHGPIPPGETSLAVRYRLPAGGSSTRFSRQFAAELPLLQVFVADTGLRIDSPRLHRKRPIVTEDRIHLPLEAFGLEPGEPITLTLEPLPARRPAGMLASAAVLAGALCALWFLAAPLRAAAPEAAEHAESASAVERAALYRSLEALDEDLETGKLSAEDHGAMRAALRARAAELIASERSQQRAGPGAAAAASAPACSACGGEIRSGDRFCSQCGARQQPAGAGAA
jgi:hypothetical protein